MWHYWIYGSRNCRRWRVGAWQGNFCLIIFRNVLCFFQSVDGGLVCSRRWTGGASVFWCMSFWPADRPSPWTGTTTHTRTSPSKDSPRPSVVFFFLVVMTSDLICLTHHRRILKKDPPFPKDMGPLAKDIIQRLLVKDPKKRLGSGPSGAENVKKHPFYQVDPAVCLKQLTLCRPA